MALYRLKRLGSTISATAVASSSATTEIAMTLTTKRAMDGKRSRMVRRMLQGSKSFAAAADRNTPLKISATILGPRVAAAAKSLQLSGLFGPF
jgi:hypothetical protein